MTGAAPAAPPRARLDALRCPRCGGAPDPKGGPGHLARCASCGVLGRIADPGGGQRCYAVHPAVDAAYAERCVAEAVAASCPREAPPRFENSELTFVPYWRITTVLAGRLEGTRARKDKTLSKVTLENGQTFWAWQERDGGVERVERELEKVHVAVVTACPLDELGLPTLGRHRQTGLTIPLHQPLEGLGEVTLFDPSLRAGAVVLDPIVGRDQAESEAEALVDAYRAGLGSGLDRAAKVETAVLDRGVLLVHVPLYHLRFRVAGGRGHALVDAAGGGVVSLDHPGAGARPDAEFPPLGAAGLAFAGGVLARAVLPGVSVASTSWTGWALAALVAGGLVLYGAFGRDRGAPGARA